MVQITIIRHSKPSQVQVPNTMSSYIWLLSHYYLQEKSHRVLWITHIQLEKPLKYPHNGASSSYRKYHYCHLSLRYLNLTDHKVTMQRMREIGGECSLTVWGIMKDRGRGYRKIQENPRHFIQPLQSTNLRSEAKLGPREGTDFPEWGESWYLFHKSSKWTRQERVLKIVARLGAEGGRQSHLPNWIPWSRADLEQGKWTLKHPAEPNTQCKSL